MADIQSSPNWLNADYIAKILNAYCDGTLKELKHFAISAATAKGENYASLMHLLNCEYVTQSQPEETLSASFIIKSRLENELMSAIEEEFDVFNREAQYYNVIQNEMEKILLSIGDETKFGPRAIFVDDRVIVQENLKLKNYSISDVKVGLNFDQCQLLLKKLAKFHAASMVLYKKNPDLFRYHLPGNVSEQVSPLHEMYINAIKSTIMYCKSNSELVKFVPKLEAFGEKIIPKMINVFSRNQADRFHVLNHGDVWVNNIMFRRNESGDVEDVILVDYQEGFYGSPGIDWNYFFFSSCQLDVFVNRRPELIENYHNHLSEVLHKLDYTKRIPTLEDVRREIVNKSFHGLATATCLLPILINEHEELADPVNFLLETDDALEKRRIIFDNPKFGARLELYLAFFEENNVL